jgi:hypothetical protein
MNWKELAYRTELLLQQTPRETDECHKNLRQTRSTAAPGALPTRRRPHSYGTTIAQAMGEFPCGRSDFEQWDLNFVPCSQFGEHVHHQIWGKVFWRHAVYILPFILPNFSRSRYQIWYEEFVEHTIYIYVKTLSSNLNHRILRHAVGVYSIITLLADRSFAWNAP